MSSTLHIRSAGPKDIDTIISLARQIWPATYQEILPPDQLRYMMDVQYSPAALRKQMIEQGHAFAIIEDDIGALGFASFSAVSDKPGVYKLYKIYVLPGLQGKGLGKLLLDHILGQITPKGGHLLQLNVSRHTKARFFYEKLGFQVIREEDVDFGNNFFMKDYVMEKKW